MTAALSPPLYFSPVRMPPLPSPYVRCQLALHGCHFAEALLQSRSRSVALQRIPMAAPQRPDSRIVRRDRTRDLSAPRPRNDTRLSWASSVKPTESDPSPHTHPPSHHSILSPPSPPQKHLPVGPSLLLSLWLFLGFLRVKSRYIRPLS